MSNKLLNTNLMRSWDEMGKYDIPAAVDFILGETKEEKLYYIGHSMGTTMFWVALNEHPSLKDKISLMVAMGPVAKVKYMISPIRFLSPFIHEVEVISYSNISLIITKKNQTKYYIGI